MYPDIKNNGGITMPVTTLSLEPWQIAAMVALIVWELTWKALALWRAARNSDNTWFIILIILNTVGILPIFYLLTHGPKQPEA